MSVPYDLGTEGVNGRSGWGAGASAIPTPYLALERECSYFGHVTVRPPSPASIDRKSPMPLWAQVLDDLRRRLTAGEFAESFPADRELIATYGVSRHTAREAVRRLQAEGLLERERGRGTTVRAPAIEQRTGVLYSLFRSIEDQGFEQRSKVLALDRRKDPAAAHHLGLPRT